MTAGTIRDVRAVLVRAPLPRPIVGPFGTLEARPNLLAVVETGGGFRGVGEVWANFPQWGCADRIDLIGHGIAPLLRGQPLDDPARLYRLLRARLRPLANQWGAPGPVHQAVAGVDVALWDAHARAERRPLADLLRGGAAGGGRRVPVYGSGIGPASPGRDIERARSDGHTRFKVRISSGPERDRNTLREGREAAGGAPLMADCNQAYDPGTLRPLADDLAAARLGWLEEPFPVDDDAAYRGWREPASPFRAIPLALGENAYGLGGIAAAMESYAPAVVQPDISKTGGITEGREIARAVVASGRRLCLHMFGGPVGLFASAHLAAATDGADWVEMDANPNPLFGTVVTEPPRVVDGHLLLPDGPGLGIELNDARVGL
ncbi:MAG TPA: mandelate racemase/muconate lactonizing enzyme family protein [Geminicoccaceae bacterium]|nr:mandelate racemase/muconate lactonizing enzyme family protein [Geminicoccaceae bacterium]